MLMKDIPFKCYCNISGFPILLRVLLMNTLLYFRYYKIYGEFLFCFVKAVSEISSTMII